MDKMKIRLAGYFPGTGNIPAMTASACRATNMADTATQTRWDAIRKDTLTKGHHTVFSNARFLFAIEGVSRQVIWAFLHNHPFYNSSQQSQRAVRMSPSNVLYPPTNRARRVVEEQFDMYAHLCERLLPLAEAALKEEGRGSIATAAKLKGIAMETARYVLPVGVRTHLYHEIDGATLFRYGLTAPLCDAPKEATELVHIMTRIVESACPNFMQDYGEPMECERPTIEHQEADKMLRRFDESVAPYGGTKLISSSACGEQIRDLFGWEGEPYSWLGVEGIAPNNFQVAHMTKYERSLIGAEAKFQKRLSHTADSQDQRHRTVPSIVPPIELCTSLSFPDFVTPRLIQRNDSVRRDYEAHMARVWEQAWEVAEGLYDRREAYYILPNAMTIRKISTGSMFGWAHKFRMRLCGNAQHEIWELAQNEFGQLQKVFPWVAEDKMGPHCCIRRANGVTPACPEGPQTCGLQCWKKPMQDVHRTV